jgi:hypothetical protein
LTLLTAAKKWVYANVSSDAPWLKVLTPDVTGPQQAVIGYGIDSRELHSSQPAEGTLRIRANGGQTLTVSVRVQAHGIRKPAGGRWMRALAACTVGALLLRLALAPLVDFHARGAALESAVEQVTKTRLEPDHPATRLGGWLALPWTSIFAASDPAVLEPLLGPARSASLNRTHEFRDDFASTFVRIVTLWLWWLGALAAAVFVRRRGGTLSDIPWSLIAGAVLGVIASASLACLLLLGDLLPHALWELLFGTGSGVGLLVAWTLLAALCWGVWGCALGLVLTVLGSLGASVLRAIQAAVATICRLCGLRAAAGYFLPAA